MNHNNFPPESLQITLTQISQAMLEHSNWHSAFIRSIICRLPANEFNLLSESHAVCKFGMWFYSENNEIPKTHPRYATIEEKHKAMHQMAAKLLLEFQETGSISVLNYDQFSNALEQFQRELTEFEREIENLLYQHDSLTGAHTRLGLLPALREQQELIKRKVQTHCCIAMMDLDKFKDINDTYGHIAGDEVLTSIVHFIADQLRPYDSIFRYGGEEFLILMPNTDLTTGYSIVDRLRTEVESLPIEITDKQLIHITASFGVAKLDSDADAEKSIELADKAMYEAKFAGRNCVKIRN